MGVGKSSDDLKHVSWEVCHVYIDCLICLLNVLPEFAAYSKYIYSIGTMAKNSIVACGQRHIGDYTVAAI